MPELKPSEIVRQEFTKCAQEEWEADKNRSLCSDPSCTICGYMNTDGDPYGYTEALELAFDEVCAKLAAYTQKYGDSDLWTT